MNNNTNLNTQLKDDSFKFTFTKDKELLHKYYYMRTEAFRSVWNLKECDQMTDDFDKISDALVVTKGEKCIAGGRLIIHKAFSSQSLTFETEDFKVQKLFSDKHLNIRTYGEISRFAISEQYRSPEICSEMLRFLAERGRRYGCSCFIVVSPIQSARFFKRIYEDIGYPCKIYKDIELPEKDSYENIRMNLMFIDLESNKSNQLLETYEEFLTA
jgi:ribosomal protein S18 acetylase RimI-like enzyme